MLQRAIKEMVIEVGPIFRFKGDPVFSKRLVELATVFDVCPAVGKPPLCQVAQRQIDDTECAWNTGADGTPRAE